MKGTDLFASAKAQLSSHIDQCYASGLFTHYFLEYGSLKDAVRLRLTNCEQRSVFDLASLTKALVTTPLIFKIVDQHQLDVGDSFKGWSIKAKPPLADALLSLKVEEILAHTSGLPAWSNFWINRLTSNHSQSEYRIDAETHLIRVLNRLQLNMNRRGVDTYSDIGPILLGYFLEIFYNQPLEQSFAELVKELGIDTKNSKDFIGYLPGERLARREIVPTGYCQLRKRELCGEVHDENCAALGGVTGHAGLFASGEALSGYLRALLTRPIGQRIIEENLQRLEKKKPLLGWRRGDDKSSRGFGDGGAIGHMGFTGCAFWVNPRTDAYAMLLTNRVIMGRLSTSFKELRAQVFSILGKIARK